MSSMEAQNMLEVLPPEVIHNIVAHTAAEDDLAIKLTSKTMKNFVPKSFTSVMASKHETIYCRKWQQHSSSLPPAQLRAIAVHRQIECAIHRDHPTRQLKHLLCTHCGCIRPRAEFADGQQRRLRTGFDKARLMARRCLPCTVKHYIRNNRWHKSKYFQVEGQTKFVCVSCQEILPVEHERFRDVKGS